ncbi:MAG TPA: YncE family protein [Burkholderiales bacterium]|jgi:YVTN family beta-propeller protein|nr:YncE family protein [Burkholderiales bacterium]
MKLRTALLCSALVACSVHEALADSDTWILATGRRDPRMYAIDFEKALRPENNNTPNAIVSRSKVALDRLDGKLLGDSANIVISEDRKTAYVVNHHGAIENDEFNPQHGGRGNIAVMNIKKMIDRRNDNTAAALERHIDSGHFGSVGLVLLKDLFVIGNAESHLTEDGGNRVTFVDRKTGSLRHSVELALGAGTPQFPCPHYPVPFVSPGGPPTFPAPSAPFVHPSGALSPVPLLSPHPAWGCFPDTNGLALGRARSGKSYVFAANGGTDDVSVIDLDSALAGNKTAEIARIPTQIGPWGIASSPDGRYIVAANRESQRVAFEGNTVSIIDVENPTVEAARVLVGTTDPNVQTRPFIPSFTPDGKEVVVPNFRTNVVSIVDLHAALANPANGVVATIPLVRPGGGPARPKGSAVTADGRYAVISGGARTTPNTVASGTVYIIDLKKRAVVATVTGVGNDPYGLAVVDLHGRDRDDD